jgi:hypothetical protein
VKTVTSGKGAAPSLDDTTGLIDDFEGVELDEAAQQAIHEILRDCAARRREVEGTPDDPDEPFIAAEQEPREMLVYDPGFKHPRKVRRRPPPAYDLVASPDQMVEPTPKLLVQPDEQFRSGPEEMSWEMLDNEEEMARIEEAVQSVGTAQSTESKSAGAKAPRGLGREMRAQPGRRAARPTRSTSRDSLP